MRVFVFVVCLFIFGCFDKDVKGKCEAIIGEMIRLDYERTYYVFDYVDSLSEDGYLAYYVAVDVNPMFSTNLTIYRCDNGSWMNKIKMRRLFVDKHGKLKIIK